MFWIFATAVGLALGFMKLGAISVWVSIMSLLIKAGLLLALAVALYFCLRSLRRRFKGTDPQN